MHVHSTVSSVPINLTPTYTQISTSIPNSTVYTMTPPYTTVTPTGTGSSGPHFQQLVIPNQVPFPYSGQVPLYTHPGHNPPPFVPSSPTHHTPHFNPMPKLEFPKFSGVDPRGWVIKVEQYFDFIVMYEFRKVKISGLHFEGQASVWYMFYQSGRTNSLENVSSRCK